MIAALVLIMGVIFLEMMQFGLYLYKLRVVESATPISGRVGLVTQVFKEVEGLSW